MAEEEHRHSKRIPFIQDVEIEGVGTTRCSDISVGGLYLDTISPFSEGQILKIRFVLPDAPALPIATEARVIYVHNNIGIGLAFEKMSPVDQERLKRFADAT